MVPPKILIKLKDGKVERVLTTGPAAVFCYDPAQFQGKDRFEAAKHVQNGVGTELVPLEELVLAMQPSDEDLGQSTSPTPEVAQDQPPPEPTNPALLADDPQTAATIAESQQPKDPFGGGPRTDSVNPTSPDSSGMLDLIEHGDPASEGGKGEFQKAGDRDDDWQDPPAAGEEPEVLDEWDAELDDEDEDPDDEQYPDHTGNESEAH